MERHDRLITSKKLFIYIIEALEDFENNSNNSDLSTTAVYVWKCHKKKFFISIFLFDF